MKVEASNIRCDSVRCGVLSNRLFGAADIVGNYYETSAYSNPVMLMQIQKTYGDDITFFTGDDFSTRAVENLEIFSDSTG